MNALRIRWAGGESTFQPGTTVRIGRDTTAEIQPHNTNVSRQHAEITFGSSGWVLRDLGSAQGTWRDGRQVDTVEVRGTVQVTLGREGRGEVFTLDASPTPMPPPARATAVVGFNAPQATEIVGTPVAATPNADAFGGGTVIVGDGGVQQRPGGALRAEALEGATVVTGDALNVECGGRSYTFHPGAEVTIGRDSQCDIVTSNPTVSRRHARLRHDGTQWQLIGEQSASGTFVDGQRITTYPLAGSVAAWLGDENTGERLVIVARGTNPSAGRKRKPRSFVPALLGAVVALVVAGVAVFVLTSGDDDTGASTDDLARATVRLIAGTTAGSGTIIDADEGLILTNAHVVAPSAPGRAVLYGEFDLELKPNPKEITVLVAPGLGEAAEPRYVAKIEAVDGYADLALIRIFKTTVGQLIEPGSHDLAGLVDVEIGDSTKVKAGEEIRVFGYPGASQSPSVTVVDGLVSGQVVDERMMSNRAFFNISAPISGGNSGGLAVNKRGELIGVPTLVRQDTVGSMRPSEFALEMIKAVREGKEYTSPYVVERTDEQVSNIAFVEPGQAAGVAFACDAPALTSLDAGAVGVAFDYEGFPDGQHQDILVELYSGDTAIGRRSLNVDWPTIWPDDSGCATITVPIDRSLITDPAAELKYLIGVGPGYETD